MRITNCHKLCNIIFFISALFYDIIIKLQINGGNGRPMESRKFNQLLKNIHSEKSFDALYDYFYRRIVFHLKYIYGENFAQEVAQDFFLQLINKETDKLGYIEFPASWIYKCCENIAKRKLSKEASDVQLNSEILLQYEHQFEYEVYGDLYDTIKTLARYSRRHIRPRQTGRHGIRISSEYKR